MPLSAVPVPGAIPALDSDANKLLPRDRPAHEWYRFVLSFPPHLVRDYLARFDLPAGANVLDPFCGTGTTVVEARKQGFPAGGVEANPVVHFAARTKCDWSPDPEGLECDAGRVAEAAQARLNADGVPDLPTGNTGGTANLRTLPAEAFKLLLGGSISPRPLHKALVLLDCIRQVSSREFTPHQELAFMRSVVADASNLKFGPEVGVGRQKCDAAVVQPWLAGVRRMAADLRHLREIRAPEAGVHLADARSISGVVPDASISAVITSPPYPNEKDYSRTTRLESVLLGYTPNKPALRRVKKGFVRSNTRSVYVEDTDHRWVEGHAEIERIASQIEERRIELGKTSGFERRYAWLTKLYFGGMARHFAELRPKLLPGARLAYVVGDQASYLQVMIRTGQLLAGIAESLGYEVEAIDLFRTRLSTATREQLREEVVVLRWPGGRG